MSTNAAAEVFKQIKTIVDVHDGDAEPSNGYSICPLKMKALGIRMAWADIDRLGWEEGDVVYPSKSLSLEAGGMYGRIRVICECESAKPEESDAEEILPMDTTIAVSKDRELVPA